MPNFRFLGLVAYVGELVVHELESGDLAKSEFPTGGGRRFRLSRGGDQRGRMLPTPHGAGLRRHVGLHAVLRYDDTFCGLLRYEGRRLAGQPH